MHGAMFWHNPSMKGFHKGNHENRRNMARADSVYKQNNAENTHIERTTITLILVR